VDIKQIEQNIKDETFLVADGRSKGTESYIKTKNGILQCCNECSYRKLSVKKYTHSIIVHLNPNVIHRIYGVQFPSRLDKHIDPSHQYVGIEVHWGLLVDRYMESLDFYFDQPNVMDEEMIKTN